MNSSSSVKIYLGDVYSALKNLQDNNIHLAITSPPYWNQRDYGIDGQIGNESTPEEYIDKLERIFDLLLIKLNQEGVFFLNIGDKYISKYGKTALGFIPFKLADKMVKKGWLLLDIIIWYKPNHMPSSVKNRFTNSYEPIFVFGKSMKNIYSKANNKTNILKINLQPTSFKHVAVFPEKLIESLLQKVKLPISATIVDPFAGSGTVLKAIQNLKLSCNTFLIEKNPEYVNIIQHRCQISSNNVIKLKGSHFDIRYEPFSNQLNLGFERTFNYSVRSLKRGFVKIYDSKHEFYNILEEFKSKRIKYSYSPQAIFLIGCKDFDLQLIIDTERLNSLGYVIRNLIVVEKEQKWYPLFFIVDDNKKFDYFFYFKKLNIGSKNKDIKKWYEFDLKGVRVEDNLSKIKKTGTVINLYKKINEQIPSFALIKWEDGSTSKEFIIDSLSSLDENLIISSDDNDIKIVEKKNLLEINDNLLVVSNGHFTNSSKYNGKFRELVRKNWGASPGARSSMEKIFFSVKRLYNVNQKLVSKYLNLKRIQKGFSKSEFTKLFPPNYKHTVGHWIRDDFGGSLPNLEDWKLITNILDIDENFTKYVCSKGLKIQTVSTSEVKPPEDFLQESFLNKLKLLYKED